MTIARGRIVRGNGAAEPALRPGPSEAQRRRITREVLDAHREASRVAQAAAEKAARDAAQAEEAKLAAAWLALRARDEKRTERDLDRAISLAVALAERLIGAALELHPEKIADLAREALAQARGARRATIEAHPDDAPMLEARLSSLGLEADVRANPELARGELCLHTDIGTLDAKLHPQLERLAAALRDALK